MTGPARRGVDLAERSGDLGATFGTVTASCGVLRKEGVMGTEDKAKNMAQNVKGKVKEAAGKATDDEKLEAEGRVDQAAADLKQAGEKAKDAFK